MNRLFPALLLVVSASVAHASVDIHGGDCGLHSDYTLSVRPERLEFTRATGTPATVIIEDGTLRVDGRALAVGAEDRRRLLAIEHGVRDTVPQVKAIAHDAIAIAFEAVGEVAAAFAKDGQAARSSAEHIARSAQALDRRIDGTDTFSSWQDADVDKLVEGVVGTLVSEILGNVAGQAISVALSGDEKAAAELEARANGIEKNVDRIVAKRATALEARADGVCARLSTLARIESDLDLRLADGHRLQLVSMDR